MQILFDHRKSLVTDFIIPVSTEHSSSSDSLPLPVSLLKNADGVVIFEDQNLDGNVQPISEIPSSTIERVSFRLLRQHEFAFPGGKVKMQVRAKERLII